MAKGFIARIVEGVIEARTRKANRIVRDEFQRLGFDYDAFMAERDSAPVRH